MKKTTLPFLLALIAPTPAVATGGLICRTAGPRPTEVALVISHTAVSSIVSARLTEDRRNVPVAVAQSWLEPGKLRIDLTDRNATHHEVRLLARRHGSGYDGSLWRNGQRRWVRCREG